MISNPEQKKRIQDALHEISNSMTRIDAERDFIKEAINAVAEEHELSKKIVRKMARVYHKQNFREEQATHEEFETLYQNIVGIES